MVTLPYQDREGHVLEQQVYLRESRYSKYPDECILCYTSSSAYYTGI
jgi:hypothetical protein